MAGFWGVFGVLADSDQPQIRTISTAFIGGKHESVANITKQTIEAI